jgi:hypothetical protein
LSFAQPTRIGAGGSGSEGENLDLAAADVREPVAGRCDGWRGHAVRRDDADVAAFRGHRLEGGFRVDEIDGRRIGGPLNSRGRQASSERRELVLAREQ